MRRNDFKRLVAQELVNGGVRFKIVYCDKEISLSWTNSRGVLCNSVLLTTKRCRMSPPERHRLEMYRHWLKIECQQ